MCAVKSGFVLIEITPVLENQVKEGNFPDRIGLREALPPCYSIVKYGSEKFKEQFSSVPWGTEWIKSSIDFNALTVTEDEYQKT